MQIQAIVDLIGESSTLAKLASLLRQIPQYQVDCIFGLEDIELRLIMPLARYCVTARKTYADRLLDSYEKAGIIPYEPILVTSDQGVRIIIPPVVERHGEGFFLMDGTHRLLALHSRDRTKVRCISVVSPKLPDLPCEPTKWDAVLVRDDPQPLSQILVGLDMTKFRQLTFWFNSDIFSFKDLPQALQWLKGDQVNFDHTKYKLG